MANTVQPEGIKMFSEVRSRPDGQAKNGTVKLEAQLVRQVFLFVFQDPCTLSSSYYTNSGKMSQSIFHPTPPIILSLHLTKRQRHMINAKVELACQIVAKCDTPA